MSNGGGMAYQTAYDLGNTAPRHGNAGVRVTARRTLNGIPTIEEAFGHTDAEWMHQAACTNADPEAWFPRRGTRDDSTQLALRLCKQVCPVQQQCLAYALGHNDRLLGIWGGTTEDQRRALREKRVRA